MASVLTTGLPRVALVFPVLFLFPTVAGNAASLHLIQPDGAGWDPVTDGAEAGFESEPRGRGACVSRVTLGSNEHRQGVGASGRLLCRQLEKAGPQIEGAVNEGAAQEIPVGVRGDMGANAKACAFTSPGPESLSLDGAPVDAILVTNQSAEGPAESLCHLAKESVTPAARSLAAFETTPVAPGLAIDVAGSARTLGIGEDGRIDPAGGSIENVGVEARGFGGRFDPKRFPSEALMALESAPREDNPAILGARARQWADSSRAPPLSPVSPVATPRLTMPFEADVPQNSGERFQSAGVKSFAPAHPAGFGLTLAIALAVSFGLLMYSRASGTRVLDNEVRRRIYDDLTKTPGKTAGEIARDLGADLSLVRYHLRHLVRANLIATRIVRRRQRYYPPGKIVDLMSLDVVSTDTARRIVAVVREKPGLSLAEISRETAVSSPLASYHAKNLQAAGIVRVERMGRRAAFYAVQDAAPSQG